MKIFLKSMFFWVRNSYEHILRISLFAAILAAITVFITVINGLMNAFILYILCFLMYFFTLELFIRILTRNPQILFYELTHELKNLEQNICDNPEVEDVTKYQLEAKFKAVNSFIQKLISRQFLYSNFFNPETEVKHLDKLVGETIATYTKKWQMMKVPSQQIIEFNKIHNPKTKKYINKIKDSIRNQKSPYARRYIFRKGLSQLMTSSVHEFVEISRKQ